MGANVVMYNLEKYFYQIVHHPMGLEWGEYLMYYLLYLCQEKEYIPKIIHELYFNGDINDNVLVRITMDYHYFQYNTKKNLGPAPTYLDKEFVKLTRINYLLSQKKQEHEKRFGNVEISCGYNIGSIHNKIIRKLSEISKQERNY